MSRVGEEIEVKVTFPEDYHAKDLAGKDAVFKCKVNEIHVKELPEADDEFAQDVSEFDTLAEYKEDMQKKLTEQKEKAAKVQKKAAVVAKVVENADDGYSGCNGRYTGSTAWQTTSQEESSLRDLPLTSTSSSQA